MIPKGGVTRVTLVNDFPINAIRRKYFYLYKKLLTRVTTITLLGCARFGSSFLAGETVGDD